jgi:hypothetical protein
MVILSFAWVWFAVVSLGCFGAAVVIYGLSHRLACRFDAEWKEARAQQGALDVWPFLRRTDFDQARCHPRLLCGRARSSSAHDELGGG